MQSLFHFNRGVLMAEEGLPETAIRDFERTVELGDPDLAPKAAFNIGFLAADREKAVQAYRWAIASRHAVVAPRAASNLLDLDRPREFGMTRRPREFG